MNALEKLEEERDAALAKLKTASNGLKILVEEEERFLKQNRIARQDVDREKGAAGALVQATQAKIDALEAKVSREIVVALSEREVKVRGVEIELADHKRELATAQYNLEALRKRGAGKEDLKEFQGQITQTEGIIAELTEDLEEAKRSLEAVQVLKREALVAAADAATAKPAAAKR